MLLMDLYLNWLCDSNVENLEMGAFIYSLHACVVCQNLS